MVLGGHTIKVYPSGADRNTWVAPMIVAAPLMFSTTTGLAQVRLNWSAMMRASVSVVEPPADGTTSRTVRVGKASRSAPCADAAALPKATAKASIIAASCIGLCIAALRVPSRWLSAISIIPFGARCRDISFRDVVRDGAAIPAARVAEAAAARRLHQDPLAGLQLVTARPRRLDLVSRTEPHHESAAPPRPGAGQPPGREAR